MYVDYFTATSASLAFLFVPKLLQAAFSKAYIVYMPVFFGHDFPDDLVVA